MTKEALAIANGDEAARLTIASTVGEFDTTLTDLRAGDAARDIPAASPTVAVHLLTIENIWEPVAAAVATVQTEPVQNVEFANALDHVLANNEALLVEMDTTVGLYAISGEEATTVVDIAGRQRMLSQKLSKEAFAVGNGDESSREPMAATAAEFDGTLRDLIDGSSERAIPAAEGELRSQLLTVQSIWQPIYEQVQIARTEPVLNPVFSGALVVLAASNATLLTESNVAVALFQAESDDKISDLKRTILIITAVAAAVILFGYWFVGRFVSGPLGRARQVEQANQAKSDFLASMPSSAALADTHFRPETQSFKPAG